MVRILALDPAASFGWILIENGQYIDGGTEIFKHPSKAKKNKDVGKGKKWFDAQNWLNGKISCLNPDYVVCEDVKRHSSTLSAHSYGFLRYSAEAACYAFNIKFFCIGVKTWKSILTGNGNSDKEAVQKVISTKFTGIEWQTDDHSDAAGIGYSFLTFLEKNELEKLNDPVGGKKTKKK